MKALPVCRLGRALERGWSVLRVGTIPRLVKETRANDMAMINTIQRFLTLRLFSAEERSWIEPRQVAAKQVNKDSSLDKGALPGGTP
jgi:hypothetical protein